MPPKLWSGLSKRVRRRREERRLTQEGLAQVIGRSHQTVYRLERGTQNMTPELLDRLCQSDALDCDPIWLAFGESVGDQTHPSFEAFLKTKQGMTTTATERAVLSSVRWPEGVTPTVGLYRLWLAGLRGLVDEEELENLADLNK